MTPDVSSRITIDEVKKLLSSIAPDDFVISSSDHLLHGVGFYSEGFGKLELYLKPKGEFGSSPTFSLNYSINVLTHEVENGEVYYYPEGDACDEEVCFRGEEAQDLISHTLARITSAVRENRSGAPSLAEAHFSTPEVTTSTPSPKVETLVNRTAPDVFVISSSDHLLHGVGFHSEGFGSLDVYLKPKGDFANSPTFSLNYSINVLTGEVKYGEVYYYQEGDAHDEEIDFGGKQAQDLISYTLARITSALREYREENSPLAKAASPRFPRKND